jgi:hypothetical protein
VPSRKMSSLRFQLIRRRNTIAHPDPNAGKCPCPYRWSSPIIRIHFICTRSFIIYTTKVIGNFIPTSRSFQLSQQRDSKKSTHTHTHQIAPQLHHVVSPLFHHQPRPQQQQQECRRRIGHSSSIGGPAFGHRYVVYYDSDARIAAAPQSLQPVHFDPRRRSERLVRGHHRPTTSFFRRRVRQQ